MGKASTRRKERRRKYLSQLAREDPERFKREWERRLKSWSNEIRWRGREGGTKEKPLFEIVRRAEEILMECGDRAVELALKETDFILGNECCKALANAVGYEMYRMVWNYDNRYRRSKRKGCGIQDSG